MPLALGSLVLVPAPWWSPGAALGLRSLPRQAAVASARGCHQRGWRGLESLSSGGRFSRAWQTCDQQACGHPGAARLLAASRRQGIGCLLAGCEAVLDDDAGAQEVGQGNLDGSAAPPSHRLLLHPHHPSLPHPDWLAGCRHERADTSDGPQHTVGQRGSRAVTVAAGSGGGHGSSSGAGAGLKQSNLAPSRFRSPRFAYRTWYCSFISRKVAHVVVRKNTTCGRLDFQ